VKAIHGGDIRKNRDLLAMVVVVVVVVAMANPIYRRKLMYPVKTRVRLFLLPIFRRISVKIKMGVE
jgi:hypothetical protein